MRGEGCGLVRGDRYAAKGGLEGRVVVYGEAGVWDEVFLVLFVEVLEVRDGNVLVFFFVFVIFYPVLGLGRSYRNLVFRFD